MKGFSTQLRQLLATKQFNRADLFRLVLPNGKVITSTNWQTDIYVGSNLLLWSQAFDNTIWQYNNCTRPTADTVVAPDGSLTAEALAYTTSGPTAYCKQVYTIPGGLVANAMYTWSVWMKAATGTPTIYLLVENQTGGTVRAIQQFTLSTTWTRYQLPTEMLNGDTEVVVWIYNPASAVTIDVWGGQLEPNNQMGPYQETQGSNINGNYYSASTFGYWEHGPVASQANFTLEANDMGLTVAAGPTVFYPGTNVSMAEGARLGLFDGVFVQVFRCYWPSAQLLPPTFTLGAINGSLVEALYQGYIKPNGKIRSTGVEFEVADAMYIMNLKLPRNLIQAGCLHTFCDLGEFAKYGTRTGCTLNPATFTTGGFVVAAGSRNAWIISTTNLPSATLFSQGVLTMTSGYNAGFSVAIKKQINITTLNLAQPLPVLLEVGDTFSVLQGCDRTMTTCQNIYNNLAHYRGAPFVPNPEQAV